MARESAIRVLEDPPLDGPTNMARDEALLDAVGAGKSPPTLRLYGWEPATISLGYFQRYGDFQSQAGPLGDLPVVRRLTGGGAILHDLELTYAIVLPTAHTLLSHGPNCLYEDVHAAVISSLAALQVPASRAGNTHSSTPKRTPFFCFARRHRFDVVIGRGKIAGSAQRRTRSAVLQHGSIILADRYGQPGLADLNVAVADTIRRLRQLLPSEVGRVAGLDLMLGEWGRAELAGADALVLKYAGPDWTRRM